MLYPLPVVLVSAAEEGKAGNLITVAWTGTVCTDPPMVSISVRPERHSYGLLRQTGEFALNLTTERMVRAVDYCGVVSGRTHDKFAETGLHAEAARQIGAPLVAESPVNLECRVTEVTELGSHHLFLASVLAVHAQDRYLDENGKFALEKARPIVYSHGAYFALGRQLGTFGYSVRKKT